MFFFAIFGNSAGGSRGCGTQITHTSAQNDIVSDLKNTNKHSIKSTSMLNIDYVSSIELNCNKYWAAAIGAIKQHWIQYEYVNYKANIAKYLLGDSIPSCTDVGWALSGSNDNKTFYTIDARTCGMQSKAISTFNVSSNQYYYRYIRLTFTETAACSSVSLGFFTMEGDLKKWKNAICTPFSKKATYMKHALTYVIICLH